MRSIRTPLITISLLIILGAGLAMADCTSDVRVVSHQCTCPPHEAVNTTVCQGFGSGWNPFYTLHICIGGFGIVMAGPGCGASKSGHLDPIMERDKSLGIMRQENLEFASCKRSGETLEDWVQHHPVSASRQSGL